MSGMFILMAVYAPASRFWALAPALIWFLFLLLLPSAIEVLRPHVTDAYYREALADVQSQFGTAYYLYCGAGARRDGRIDDRTADCAAASSSSSAALRWSFGLSAFLVPIGAAIQQEPIKQAALLARERGWEVIMWRLNAPSFSVYYGRPTMSREPKPGDLVLTKAKRLAELHGLQHELVYAKNGIVLVRIH